MLALVSRGRGRCLSGYGGSDAVGVGDAAGCSERRNVAGRKRPWLTLCAQGVRSFAEVLCG